MLKKSPSRHPSPRYIALAALAAIAGCASTPAPETAAPTGPKRRTAAQTANDATSHAWDFKVEAQALLDGDDVVVRAVGPVRCPRSYALPAETGEPARIEHRLEMCEREAAERMAAAFVAVGVSGLADGPVWLLLPPKDAVLVLPQERLRGLIADRMDADLARRVLEHKAAPSAQARVVLSHVAEGASYVYGERVVALAALEAWLGDVSRELSVAFAARSDDAELRALGEQLQRDAAADPPGE